MSRVYSLSIGGKTNKFKSVATKITNLNRPMLSIKAKNNRNHLVLLDALRTHYSSRNTYYKREPIINMLLHCAILRVFDNNEFFSFDVIVSKLILKSFNVDCLVLDSALSRTLLYFQKTLHKFLVSWCLISLLSQPIRFLRHRRCPSPGQYI